MNTTVQRKICFKCGRSKTLDEFYVHPRMADGHLNKCKECTKTDVSANYETRHDQYVEYDRRRASLPHRRAATKQYARSHPDVMRRLKAKYAHSHPEVQARYKARYPEKKRAHDLVSNAIRDGKLIRKPCEACGDTNVHAHHDDYGKPLEVRWLCQKHHLEVHGKMIYTIV